MSMESGAYKAKGFCLEKRLPLEGKLSQPIFREAVTDEVGASLPKEET